MAASTVIQVAHWVDEIWTDVLSKIRFKLADNDTLDEVDPLLVFQQPVMVNGTLSQYSLSYWKTFRFYVTAAAIGELSNLRFFRSAGVNSGIDEFYGYTEAYQQAVGNTEGTNVSGLASTVAIISMATAPAAVSNGKGPFVGVGRFGDMVVIQWRVGPDAGPIGTDLNEVVYTFRYDEI